MGEWSGAGGDPRSARGSRRPRRTRRGDRRAAARPAGAARPRRRPAGRARPSSSTRCGAIEPPADEANALQTLVSRLRRALGDAAPVGAVAGRLPAGDRAGRRRRAPLRAARRRGVAGAARRRPGRVRRECCAKALALWRGPALADAGDALRVPAARLDDLRLAAIVDRLDGRHRSSARPTSSCPSSRRSPPSSRWTSGSPGSWSPRWPARGGRPTRCAPTSGCATRLADELGVDPSAELQAVHLALLRGELGPSPTPGARAPHQPQGAADQLRRPRRRGRPRRQGAGGEPARHAGRPGRRRARPGWPTRPARG